MLLEDLEGEEKLFHEFWEPRIGFIRGYIHDLLENRMGIRMEMMFCE